MPRAEIECPRCGHTGTRPHVWLICPTCGADIAPIERPAEPAHERAGARGEEEIDTFAQFDLSIDVNNPQEG